MARALFVLVLNLWNLSRRLMRGTLRLLLRPFRKKRRRFVDLKLPSGVELGGQPKKLGPLTIGFESKGPWWTFSETVDRLAKDDRIEGVYFRVTPTNMGLSELRTITARLDQLRQAGKRIVCHLDQAMLKDYVLATAADEVLMTPPGRLYTFGMRMDLTLAADALDKAGIGAQFIHLGRFKTAMHRVTRRQAPQAQEIMMRQLLTSVSSAVVDQVAKRRKLESNDVVPIFDIAPVSAREARRRKLIDGLVYRDQVKEWLRHGKLLDKSKSGSDDVAEDNESKKAKTDDGEPPVFLLGSATYMAATKPLSWRPIFRRKKKVAVLDLHGTILTGQEGLPTGFGNTLTPKKVVGQLKRMAKDDRTAAVVLHIHSPGGSALASDLIWRQIRRLADKKPVVAVLGDIAASGGYYLAVGAHSIVAQPEAIVGSIGVIAGKLNGSELLSRLGVRLEALSTSETSRFTSLASELSPRELDNLQRDIREFYRRFVQRVAAGRKLPRHRVHRMARGRVYTGRQAHALGLVDELGGLDDAIDLACRKAQVQRDQIDVVYTEHRSAQLKSLLSRKKQNLAMPTALDLLPETWQQLVVLGSLLRQPAAMALWPVLPRYNGDRLN